MPVFDSVYPTFSLDPLPAGFTVVGEPPGKVGLVHAQVAGVAAGETPLHSAYVTNLSFLKTLYW